MRETVDAKVVEAFREAERLISLTELDGIEENLVVIGCRLQSIEECLRMLADALDRLPAGSDSPKRQAGDVESA
jgi:hypothetical protein